MGSSGGADAPRVGEVVTIRRVYNNNVVLGADPTGAEVVLLGKGIGYARRPGDPVDPAGCQRFVAEHTYQPSQVADLLSGATLEQVEAARAIVAVARDDLGLHAGASLLLPVLDHLTFAVTRADAGLTVDFPLRWEIGQVFGQECAAGRRAQGVAERLLGLRFQDDEWVAFALHFINHRWACGDLTGTLALTETIARSFEVLAGAWGTRIDRDSMSAARFVTHLRYLFVRALEDRQLAGSQIDIMTPTRERYPSAVDGAVQVAALIADAVGHELTDDEVAYLALHTARLYTEVSFGGTSA